MKKRFGVGLILGLILIMSVAVLAARLPTVNGDNNAWGTVLNEYLEVAHDTGGNLKNSYITSAMITDATIVAIDLASGSVNSTAILDKTIAAVDINDDVINATHLSAVSTLIFGQCTREVPAFGAATVSNDTNSNGTAAGNCTITGASTGNPVIINLNYGDNAYPNKINPNLTIVGAKIVGSNLSINFTREMSEVQAAIPQASLIRFDYIVFVNGTG